MESGAAGCVFAKILACKRERSGFRTYSYDATSPSAELTEHINDVTTRDLGQSEAVAFLFPRFKTPRQVATLLNLLGRLPEWSLSEADPGGRPSIGFSVGLRWRQPNYRFVSFVLGFADLPTMPATRRAPSVALVLRPNGLGPAPGIIAETRGEVCPVQKLESGRIPVHLADMETSLANPRAVANIWNRTEALKRRKLAKCPFAAIAKAKMTFNLPDSCRKNLTTLTPTK